MFTENACKEDNFLSGDLVEDLLEIIINAKKHERLVKIEKLEHFLSKAQHLAPNLGLPRPATRRLGDTNETFQCQLYSNGFDCSGTAG